MEYAIPIIALVLIFGPRLFSEIKDFWLKKEQIKADALVRAEALRLKNELELEKFIQSEQSDRSYQQVNSEADTSSERPARNRIRN